MPRQELLLKWPMGLGTHSWSAHFHIGAWGGAGARVALQCGTKPPWRAA
eukprot:COSAG01_NODE_59898_length_297_cov_1.308081_1_plen_48_part_10